MYASGTFSACAPYGMCWEPSAKAMTLRNERNSVSARSAASVQAALEQVSAGPTAPHPRRRSPRLRRRAVRMGARVGHRSCPRRFRSSRWWLNVLFHRGTRKMCWRRTTEEYSALSAEAYAWELRQRWSWPVCHYARWIYRNHRYHVVVRPRRPHHPVHWVRVGKQTGFVPAHPGDQKDKPPVNLKHGVFTVAPGAGGGRRRANQLQCCRKN